ncbi:MAG: hypothetical protein GX335_10655 [Firmicutes bacterium]|nr:hypothetical protein [Bacillota bacterium]
MKELRKLWAFFTEPKVYWRLFSLLLAVIFWLLAAGDGSLGGLERVVPLTVEVENIPDGLVLLEPPQQVRLKIRGLAPVLDQSEGLIKARIDLRGAAAGTETYPVNVQVPSGVEILSIAPSLVSVYTEEKRQKVFPVTLAVLGLNSGGRVPGFVLNPAAVTVTAPGSILEKVDHLLVYLNLAGGPAREAAYPVRALDSGGRDLDLVQIEPAEVKVQVKE